MDALNGNFRTALDEDRARRVLKAQFDDLASEVLEIEASPYGRIALQLGDPEAGHVHAEPFEVRPGNTSTHGPPDWARDLTPHLKQFRQFWGAGDGVKAAAGSNGHQIVLKAGHAFGKKFKPWEAVRAANTIDKVARVGGAVLSIGLEAYSVFADERASVQAEIARAVRRRSIPQEVLRQADGVVVDALLNLRANLDEVFGPELQRIDALTGEIRDTPRKQD